MEITTKAHDHNIMVLEISGEIDAYTSKSMNKTLNDLLDQDYSRFVIDLSEVTLISSVGLKDILFAHREASSKGGGLKLLNPSSHIKRTLEISGLYELLNVCKTQQEAMDGWA